VFEDIFTEATALVAGGHKELILTGINIGTYSYQDKTLMGVIKAMNALEGLERLRISSIEPTTISKDILDTWAARTISFAVICTFLCKAGMMKFCGR
jgi:threonylcarbamoyladenosine tRNA methylthiotransferase MtaB